MIFDGLIDSVFIKITDITYLIDINKTYFIRYNNKKMLDINNKNNAIMMIKPFLLIFLERTSFIKDYDVCNMMSYY